MSRGTPLQEQIRAALETAVLDAKAPGAVAYVGDLEHTHAHVAVGARQLTPQNLPAEPNTIYDIASITKVMATTTAILLLHENGLLDLDAPVSKYLPIPAFGQFTPKHCLTHTAGLNPGKPLYKECATIDAMLERYSALPLNWAPGTRWLYSDVGFMILGRIVEMVAGETLDAFCQNRIFSPLKMNDTCYNPPADWAQRCAATEQCSWRGKMMLGQVHDENAYAVGGVAGHAGLFSTAPDIAIFARSLLSGKILKPETLNRMLALGLVPAWPWQGFGWQLDGWPTKKFGFLPTRDSFGHVGWTGTSLWLDSRANRFVILLSNTCHPTRAARDNETLRLSFNTAISNIYYAGSTNAHTGLDRLLREDFNGLRGKRVALLTHHAAIDQLSRSILDVFALAPDVKLMHLFSPEHGLSGKAEAGAEVGQQESKLPVISLYGKRTAPTADELRDIDVLVIDLQDVGARYYTYAATMKACMKACIDAGVQVLVLDRPNPAGGLVVEGPIATNTGSLVCWGAVPARHGMTLGEIAEWFRQTEFKNTKLKLAVNLLDSWQPGRLFSECSLPWVPPSPNIPSPETALLYTGTCLFEGTNISEGRGTDAPFSLIGAPWLDAPRVIAAIEGESTTCVALEPVKFTPRSIPGKAANPKYLDEECNGIRIALHEPHAARPFTLAVALITATRRIHPRKFAWEKAFDILAGSTMLRERIDHGEDALSIIRDAAPSLAEFDALRPKLYAQSIRKP